MRSVVVLTALFAVSLGSHFRSLLLERACLKRPTLAFCQETLSTTTSTTTTTTTRPTTTTPEPTTALKLVPPPNFQELVMHQQQQKAAAATTPSAPTRKNEDLGSLLRLPKPANSTSLIENELADENELHTHNATVTANGTIPAAPTAEDEKTVLVYVSDYCVAERERFVKSCHGDVDKRDLPFCKAYPPACASAPGVLPVISYCQRYYKQYPKHCTGTTIAENVIQFCYAFEQFCLPELTPAQPIKVASESPRTNLKRCEDVVDEARKVCNPFPNPKDTFNVVRCTSFLTNCKEYIDWA